MRVLGIDPGSNATGWALVVRRKGGFQLEDAGVIRVRAGSSLADRLLLIHTRLVEVLDQTHPDQVSIEAIFRHRSSESALRLGHARGVAMLAVAQAGLTAAEYNPVTIKKTVGGHGRAGKPEMIRLVARLLGLPKPLAADASDAAAIAMTHLLHARFQRPPETP